MALKQLTEEQKQLLKTPLPAEAVRPHPTKTFLSSINAIYVSERLNDVFGIGAWNLTSEFITMVGKMVVMKVHLSIPDYGFSFENYGGNDNADIGDAYKGAITDGLTKICAIHLGIGADVWKDKKGGKNQPQAQQKVNTPPKASTVQNQPQNAKQAPRRRVLNDAVIDTKCDAILAWLDKELEKDTTKTVKQCFIDAGYEIEDHADLRITEIYVNHVAETMK